MDELEAHGYSIEWVQDDDQELICESRTDDIIEENDDIDEEEYLVGEEIIPSTEIITISNSLDQIAAENLIYMAQDGTVTTVMGDLIEEQVEQADNADYNEQQYFECQVTEEVITDDWVQQQGGERVEVPVDQLTTDSQNDEIPLPTDAYMSSRPYPCDFCSRRFRKKANLMNHMVAHKNDRPHICNLCGARYIRKIDLLDHLKIHAQMPENDMDYMDQLLAPTGREQHIEEEEEELLAPRKPTRARKKPAAAGKAATAASIRKQQQLQQQQEQQQLLQQQQQSQQQQQQGRVKNEPDDKYSDDIKYLMEAARQHETYEEEQHRFPVTNANRPFVCQKCGVSFAREKALTAHARLHCSDNVLECDSCSNVFWDIAQLHEHQRIQHGGNSSNSEYEIDKDETFDSENESFYCSVCGMSFHRIELLKRHGRTHMKDNLGGGETTEQEVKHCCNVCGDTFAEALDLLAHAEIHARTSLYKCTLCGEAFADEKTIKKHITTFHFNELTDNSCRICGKQCKDQRSLLKHAWDHSKEKKHACVNCGKNFHNKARLRRHMQSHRNKSVTCNICGDVFADGRSLMNHRHSHTNISGRQFPCRECGKTFGSRSSQQIHMRIHTGERPYGCRFCWKAFADGGTLRKHERIHTGEKPYACPVCPRAFNQRVVLREHIRSHHSSVDPTYSSTAAPHYCVVCGDRFKTPKEIIQHLIEHSDSNTASKRQPTTGPRKYKRRRKLKPDELERWRSNMTTVDAAGNVDESKLLLESDHNKIQIELDESLYVQEVAYTNKPTKAAKGTQRTNNKELQKQRQSDSSRVDDLLNELDPLNDIAPVAVSDAPSYAKTTARSPTKKRAAKVQAQAVVQPDPPAVTAARPKMIHTHKTRVAVEDGTRKSRTMVTRRGISPPPSPVPTPTRARSKRTTAASTSRQTSTRTMTTNDISASPPAKLTRHSQRNDHDIDTSLAESNLLLELSKKNLNYSPDVVNDLEEILRSPIKSKDMIDDHSHDNNLHSMESEIVVANTIVSPTRVSKRISTRQTQRQSTKAPTPRQTPLRSSIRISKQSTDDELINSIVMNIKQEKEESYTMTSDEFFTCEMCSAVFRDRAQLLVHVPIHI